MTISAAAGCALPPECLRLQKGGNKQANKLQAEVRQHLSSRADIGHEEKGRLLYALDYSNRRVLPRPRHAGPPAAAVWELLHLKRLGLLLLCEEAQMQDDYAKMDAFSVPVYRRGFAAGGAPILQAKVVGLEERHPPALIGDVVRLRLAALPQFDIPCRLVAIEKRVHLLFTPALSAGRADGPERHDQHPLCPLLRDASLAKHRGEAPHCPHCRRLRGFVKDTLLAGGLG
ncbi:hypothetical protein EMIHUDRAFT_451811, partial [Emiliania huxleyi CCMP1516]|uniref:Uncharacterized protein n=2 Tax=Emiliania huxleyi TaxID=2903 RepID=A0A0D3IT13_EMIH1